jgi:hypothetical protein
LLKKRGVFQTTSWPIQTVDVRKMLLKNWFQFSKAGNQAKGACTLTWRPQEIMRMMQSVSIVFKACSRHFQCPSSLITQKEYDQWEQCTYRRFFFCSFDALFRNLLFLLKSHLSHSFISLDGPFCRGDSDGKGAGRWRFWCVILLSACSLLQRWSKHTPTFSGVGRTTLLYLEQKLFTPPATHSHLRAVDCTILPNLLQAWENQHWYICSHMVLQRGHRG